MAYFGYFTISVHVSTGLLKRPGRSRLMCITLEASGGQISTSKNSLSAGGSKMHPKIAQKWPKNGHFMHYFLGYLTISYLPHVQNDLQMAKIAHKMSKIGPKMTISGPISTLRNPRGSSQMPEICCFCLKFTSKYPKYAVNGPKHA